MGLGTRDNVIYVSIREGKLNIAATSQTENAIAKVMDDGSTKYYSVYDNIEGVITGFSTKEDEYNGKKTMKLMIRISDGKENYILQMSVESAYFRGFATKVPNIDFSKKILIAPVLKEENGKKQYGLLLKQGEDWLKSAFTKDNPNGMPEIVPLTNAKGAIVSWDSSLQNDFLLNIVNEASGRLSTPTTVAVTEGDFEETQEQSEDDLPF